MFQVDRKINRARTKITQLYSRYSETQHPGITEKIDRTKELVETMETKTGTQIRKISQNLEKITSLQCLGFQLPIPDLEDSFKAVTLTLDKFTKGDFVNQIINKLDILLQDQITDISDKFEELKTAIALKTAKIEESSKAVDYFRQVQAEVSKVTAALNSAIGCAKEIGNAVRGVKGIIKETDKSFAMSLDAVERAEEIYSEPGDILNEARNRATASAGLDTKMADAKNRLLKGLEDF